MSYTKRPDMSAEPGEIVCQLDESGHLVAVRCDVVARDGWIEFKAKGRVINECGAPEIDGLGKPIEREFTFPVQSGVAAAKGPENIARQCLRCILGESLDEWPSWPDFFLDAHSIRRAIDAANMATGTVDAGAVL